MLLALVLSGCDQRISQNNLEVVNRLYEKSEKGGRPVSKKEVESVLGQPAKIEKFTMTPAKNFKRLFCCPNLGLWWPPDF